MERRKHPSSLQLQMKVLDFFRENFEGTHYKNLRMIYIALCEVASRPSRHTNTMIATAKCAGVTDDTARPYIRALRQARLIKIRRNEKGNTVTVCNMAQWTTKDQNVAVYNICRVLKLQQLDSTMQPKIGLNYRTSENWVKEQEEHPLTIKYNGKSSEVDPTMQPKIGLNCSHETESSSARGDEVRSTIIPLHTTTHNNKISRSIRAHAREERDLQEQEITPSMFDTFWKAYPRHVGKLEAKRAWEKICKVKDRPILQEVLDAISTQSKTQQWQDKRFIPHPTTWLNQGRWMDEVDEADFSSTVPSKRAQMTTGWTGTIPKSSSKKIKEVSR